MHEAVLRKLGQAAGLVEPPSHSAMKSALTAEEKKFAELIVRECLAVMSNTAGVAKQEGAYRGAEVPTSVHQLEIEKYFGLHR